MAAVQLNKPLYKSENEDENFTPPTPRKPQSHVIGRAAALFLDGMLLHLVFASIIRFAPAIPLSLGYFAPWVGLLIGYLYFSLGFSQIFLGRTLGKLITRIQVCDLSGNDLPLPRAMMRAALLFWPLPMHIILYTTAERFANTDPTSIYTTLEVFSIMLIVGWVLGNAGFAAFDPLKRTLIDRLCDTIVINAELEAEPTAAYLAEARVSNNRPPARASIYSLGIALTLCMAFATASALMVMRQLRDMKPEMREISKQMIFPGYGKAMPAAPLLEQSTTETVSVAYHFRRRVPIDVNTLKNDDAVSATLDRLIGITMGPEFYNDMASYLNSENLSRGKQGLLPLAPPSRLHFEMSFAEFPDLFFAKESQPVYTLSKDVAIEPPTTSTATAK